MAVAVAVLVGKHQIVDAGDESGLERGLGGAVLPQPVPVVEVVDRVEPLAVEQDAIAVQADRDGHHDVDDLGLPAQLLESISTKSRSCLRAWPASALSRFSADPATCGE